MATVASATAGGSTTARTGGTANSTPRPVVAIKVCRDDSEAGILRHLQGLGCAVPLVRSAPMLVARTKTDAGVQFDNGFMIVTEWQRSVGMLGDFTAGNARQLSQLCVQRSLQLVQVQS